MNEFFSFDYVKSVFPDIGGVVHIGAHYAEEAWIYDSHGMPVLWFEGHPEYAKKMLANLEGYSRQQGFEALFSDRDDEEVTFWLTADEYASSILKPAWHQIQNPHAKIVGTIPLRTRRFDTWVKERNLSLDHYNCLVLDVQGAELKVLRGMGNMVQRFDVIATEYSTVEFYENVPRLEDLEQFLSNYKRIFPEPGSELEHADALFVRRI